MKGNIIEFALVFDRECQKRFGYIAIAHDLKLIRRNALTLEHYNERACDKGLTPKQDRRYKNLQAHITRLCLPYGVEPIFNTDPRGAAFAIKTPVTGTTNTWGGAERGFCLFIK